MLVPRLRIMSFPTVVMYFSKDHSKGAMPSSILDSNEYAMLQSNPSICGCGISDIISFYQSILESPATSHEPVSHTFGSLIGYHPLKLCLNTGPVVGDVLSLAFLNDLQVQKRWWHKLSFRHELEISIQKIKDVSVYIPVRAMLHGSSGCCECLPGRVSR